MVFECAKFGTNIVTKNETKNAKFGNIIGEAKSAKFGNIIDEAKMPNLAILQVKQNPKFDNIYKWFLKN